MSSQTSVISFAKTREEMEESVKTRTSKILVDSLFLGEGSVAPEASLDDMGADSLDMIEIAMALEDEFNIQIDDSEVSGLQTVQDVINLVMSKH